MKRELDPDEENLMELDSGSWHGYGWQQNGRSSARGEDAFEMAGLDRMKLTSRGINRPFTCTRLLYGHIVTKGQGGTMTENGYAMRRNLDIDFDEADRRTRAALEEEGFGVLTEIDVKATLKKKLDEDFRRYEILGACNPPLAHRALQADGDIGLLLPCNVVIQESGDGGTIVEAVDPVVQMSVAESAGLPELAGEVRSRLVRVLDRIEEGG